MKKIDIHAHVTNRWLKDRANNDASIATLERKMREFDVEKTVVLASYFPHRGSGISNFRLLNWINGNRRFLMFGSLDFQNYLYQGINELTELSENRELYGIKIYTGYQKIDLKSPQFNVVMTIARKHSLPLMFHTGHSHNAMRRYGRPAITDLVTAKDLDFLLEENLDLQFIFSHMSKPHFNEMATIATEYENVYTDVSGLIDSKHDRDEIPVTVDNVREFLEYAGPDRLLFGTDFPVQTHEDSIYFVEQAMKNFDDYEKKKVYYDNAWRLLGKNE